MKVYRFSLYYTLLLFGLISSSFVVISLLFGNQYLKYGIITGSILGFISLIYSLCNKIVLTEEKLQYDSNPFSFFSIRYSREINIEKITEVQLEEPYKGQPSSYNNVVKIFSNDKSTYLKINKGLYSLSDMKEILLFLKEKNEKIVFDQSASKIVNTELPPIAVAQKIIQPYILFSFALFLLPLFIALLLFEVKVISYKTLRDCFNLAKTGVPIYFLICIFIISRKK